MAFARTSRSLKLITTLQTASSQYNVLLFAASFLCGTALKVVVSVSHILDKVYISLQNICTYFLGVSLDVFDLGLNKQVLGLGLDSQGLIDGLDICVLDSITGYNTIRMMMIYRVLEN